MRFKKIVGAKRFTQKAITKTTRTWAFYYVIDRGADLQVLNTFECKQPARTNVYKQLQKKWNDKGVTAIGYTTDLNDPFLVWPQTQMKP